MAGIRTCDRESQVQRPNHYTTEPRLTPPSHKGTVLYKSELINEWTDTDKQKQ